ncbi:MAG: DUF1538 domain-containing protein [Gudongella sp.]|nr:DUF1538 domain-containing protein [Gudongella sp.]
MNLLLDKFKEVSLSVLPITIIVILLNFTLTPLDGAMLITFIMGVFLIVMGLTLFLIGVDIGIAPLGRLLGATLSASNKVFLVVLAGLVLGFLISVAEPGLMVLASQVDAVTDGGITSTTLLVIVSLGLAVMVAFGLLRIVYNIPLYKVLTVLYGITFLLAIFTPSQLLTIAFDTSGATTGILAVPFILALSVGVSALKKDSKAGEKDSFGLVSIASVGAIMSVMILSIFSDTGELSSTIAFQMPQTQSLFDPFSSQLSSITRESILSLAPLLIILVFLQKASFKLEKKAFGRLLKGFVYSFLGLVLFMTGVNGGFMNVGTIIGYTLASRDSYYFLILMGTILGIVTMLAEPAVYVLTHQIEEVTSGYVKRRAVLTALALGGGLAIGLSMLRIVVPGIQLWHYLLPGYALSIGLSYIVPKLFVGMAFDAGGVATGPMTATFILAFTQGAAEAIPWADILLDGFGMIAMVALMPILTLQILGLFFSMNSGKEGVESDQ